MKAVARARNVAIASSPCLPRCVSGGGSKAAEIDDPIGGISVMGEPPEMGLQGLPLPRHQRMQLADDGWRLQVSLRLGWEPREALLEQGFKSNHGIQALPEPVLTRITVHGTPPFSAASRNLAAFERRSARWFISGIRWIRRGTDFSFGADPDN